MARICFLSRVRPDKLAEYRRRHTAVWPEMLEALRDAGWRHYSLYLTDDGLLIGHLECEDFAAAQQAMKATKVNARWQREMADYFLGEGHPDRGFSTVPEIFHLEDQLRSAGLPAHPPQGMNA